LYLGIVLSKRLRARVKAFVRRKGRFWTDYGRAILGFFIVFSVLFLPLILANALALLNGSLDRGPEDLRRTIVAGKSHSGGGRSAHVYTLQYPSWREGALSESLGVPKDIFDEAQVGSGLEIVTKPGRLRVEWIVSYRLTRR
jgi:hypothetical protein